MLRVIDEKFFYDRSDKSAPFLLVYGHQIQSRLLFMSYLSNGESKEVVYIYANYRRSVRNALQNCGKYRILWGALIYCRVQEKYLHYIRISQKLRFASNIIPLVSEALKI